MIGRLRGVIVDRLPDGSCTVEVGGVGYEVFVPIGTLGRLPSPPEEVVLHIHTHVREDAFLLYGFARAEDRAAFRVLLGVSSIGPKLAIAILGGMDARQLAAAIATQDKTRFKGIPGVGKRIVERLLLELKDKLGFVALSANAPLPAPPKNGVKAPPEDGEGAALLQVAALLVNMGFKPVEADRAVASIAEDSAGQPVERLIKLALAQLS